MTKVEIKTEYDCDLCEDTGLVQRIEKVWLDEPHYAVMGTEECICQYNWDEDHE